MKSRFLKNIKNIFADHTGFTLVEITVAMIISSICLIAVGGILISSLNFAGAAQKNASEKRIGTALSDFVKTQTEMGESLTSFSGDTATLILEDKQRLIYIGDDAGSPANKGYLWYQSDLTTGGAINIFPESFYDGMLVSVDLSQTQNSTTGVVVVKETVHLYRDDEDAYTTNHTFQLINRDKQATWEGNTASVGATDGFCFIVNAA
ncbi:MAG: prepilin-type N-terminal cleavage/methylation domain-containing protein [Clostridiales Family XIII bacterium]|nr:prepilin-type N-terminal cleavage/methylation domain-containing protein [Clostridiales Family XIII bacterium]